jgi:hypothetical protein
MTYQLPGVLLFKGEVLVTVEVNDERSVTLEVSSDGETIAVEFSAEEFEILSSFVASQQDRVVDDDYQEAPEAEEPDFGSELYLDPDEVYKGAF